MKSNGSFIKAMSLNEVIQHHLFKLNFNIGILFDSF
jgi:hypothetical protein